MSADKSGRDQARHRDVLQAGAPTPLTSCNGECEAASPVWCNQQPGVQSCHQAERRVRVRAEISTPGAGSLLASPHRTPQPHKMFACPPGDQHHGKASIRPTTEGVSLPCHSARSRSPSTVPSPRELPAAASRLRHPHLQRAPALCHQVGTWHRDAGLWVATQELWALVCIPLQEHSAWPPSKQYQEWPSFCCACQGAVVLISPSLSPCFLGLSISRYLSKNLGCCRSAQKRGVNLKKNTHKHPRCTHTHRRCWIQSHPTSCFHHRALIIRVEHCNKLFR